ncbi:MAG: glycosyltransferase family A protein [Archangium sp.]
MAQQIVGDLRTLVARRAGLKRRVALLVPDEALRASLEQNGCTVLVDPPSVESLAEFRPDVVVAFDGFASERAESFKRLASSVPEAELVFSFANASSAGLLLRGLLGVTPSPASSEKDVRAWLTSAGYVVRSRDVVVMPHVPVPLSADTEAAFRQVFEQLNPDAAADRVLLIATRGVEASRPERTKGLTSIVVSSSDDTGALEGTLRSVAGQLRKPMELIVVSALPEFDLDRALKSVRGRAGLELVVQGGVVGDALARTNVGIELARGQYVACVEAGELLERSHLSTLVKRLEDGTAAWAVSGDVGTRFDVRTWLEAGAVHRSRYVVDRERIGSFAFLFAEGVELAEAMMFCRLSALFPPSWMPGASTVDTQRTVKSEPAALREVLAARPLRTLTTLDLRAAEPVDLVEEIQSRVTARNETAGKLFVRGRELVERVRDAAEKARASAKEELEKKP